MRIRDSNEILNFGKIVAGKQIFCCFTNPLVDIPVRGSIAPNYPAISLIVPMIPLISGFTAFGSATPGFLAPGCPVLGLFVHLIPSSPTLPRLGLFVIPLVGLDAFSPYFSLASIVDDGTIKLLAKVIVNFFDNNPSIIAHCSYDGCIDEQACISLKVEVTNLSLVIFDA